MIKAFLNFQISVFISILFLSGLSLAQNIFPSPVNGEIELSKINSYIHFHNPTTSQMPLNLSVGTNAYGIKIQVSRCEAPVRKYQTCYIIVSFPNYLYNTQEISVPLNNGATLLTNLVFHPIAQLNQGSLFSVSSMSLNNFDLVSVVIQNKTASTKSYNPILSGIDSSKYSIILNRCSGNIVHNGTCLVYFKLNPQRSGNYSATLSEPQVSNSVTITSSISGSTQGVIPEPIESIEVSPSFLNFGTIKNLGPTASKSITITNNGNIAISPIVSVVGTGLEIAINRCLILLSPNQSCTVSVLINVTNSLFNGTQSGLFISSQASTSTTPIFTSVLANLDVAPTLIGSSPGSSGSFYNPTYSSYSPTLEICDGSIPLTRTITQCFGVSENAFVSLGLCIDPAPSILGQSPAGNINQSIVSGYETYYCELGSSVKQFISRTCFSPSVDNGEFCSLDLLYFGARLGGNGTSFHLHVSDGTGSGTSLVKAIEDGGPLVQDSEFFSFNGKSFFEAGDATHGSELWTSNSTSVGTFLIKDINPGIGNSNINAGSAFARLNSSQVLFTADDGVHGIELWITNGTEAGTNMVKDIFPGSTRSNISKFAILNGKAYFAAKDSTSVGLELWVTDGTDAGTYLLKDIATQANGNSNPSQFVVFNNKVFFTATTTANGNELWTTDGTTLGTQLLKDITGNVNSSTPSELTVVGNQLFFSAQDASNGRELWKSDGTTLGTVMVKNIVASSGSSNPGGLIASGNKLFFYATDGVTGYEPYVSDGTSLGTLFLKDILVGSGSSLPSAFTYYNGLTYFRAMNPLSIYEIYVSDGTPSGTSLFYKLNLAGTSITQPKFVILNNLLYFNGNNGFTGSELFVTDGTIPGTQLIIDINGTNLSSIIGEIYFIQLTPLIP